MAPPLFEPVPQHFLHDLLTAPENVDRYAAGALNTLNSLFLPDAQHRYYGWGSWGFTVLRTVYTPESDALFPVAMQRLRGIVRYWCHYTRFPFLGPACARAKIHDAGPNEELFRRCFLDVIQDRDGLAHLDSDYSNPGLARFTALANYFRQWLAGIDTGSAFDLGRSSRFSCCLVVDAESLASLAEIPDELPPLQCPANMQEKRASLNADQNAWLWLLEPRYMERPAWHEDSYQGWLRVNPRQIHTTWSAYHFVNDSDRWHCLGHKEDPQGSGIYRYCSVEGP